jgi:tetratricopeptide (TPR) repeat protein
MVRNPRGVNPLALVLAAMVPLVGYAAGPASAVRPVDDAVARASALELSGRPAEAVRVYEEMAQFDPVRRKVLAPRLVSLYASLGNAPRSLFWAQQAMVDNPDPQAYLAGVHTLLGQHAEAASLLATELARTNTATRAVALRWQLADLQLQQGRTNAALETLHAAEKSAKGSELEKLARQRVERLLTGRAPQVESRVTPPLPPPYAADPEHQQ